MEQLPLDNPGGLRRLNQCFLCKGWFLEATLKPIEIPDQAGWIEKKACRKCLNQIVNEED